VLPIRTSHTPDTPFAEHLARCGTLLREAYEHGDVPFELLLEKLEIPRLPGLKPLIQVTVAAHQDSAPLSLSGLHTEYLPPERHDVHDDLTLYLGTTPQGAVVDLDYRSGLFDRETVTALAHAYVRLLDAACTGPQQPVAALIERADAGSPRPDPRQHPRP
jgi:non-ribosomal peptide synthetase component F